MVKYLEVYFKHERLKCVELAAIETGIKYRHDGVIKQFREADIFAH